MKKNILFGFLFILCSVLVYSQEGSLDPTFGDGGKVITSVNGVIDRAYGTVIQNDGKIVVAGYTYSSISGNDFVCIRYNENGSLDTTFGNNGIATFDLQMGSDDVANSIDIQTDGKLVLAGYSDDGSNKDGAVIRLNTDGTLDTSFGNSGKVFTNFSVSSFNPIRQDEYKVVKIHHLTGNIVVGGISYLTDIDSEAIFARYTSDGELDTTFSDDGMLINLPKPIEGWDFLFTIEDLAIKSNGKITAVGWIKPITGTLWHYATHYECRLNSNGTFDTTFATTGYDTMLFATSDNKSYSVILNPDDSFYYGGNHPWNNNNNRLHFGLTNSTGTGGNSITIESWQGILFNCYAIAKNNSGNKMLVGGSIVDYATGNSSFFLTRLAIPNFAIDQTFGTSGIVTTHFDNSTNEAFDMKIQSDDKIVLVGFSGNNIALARYTLENLSIDNIGKSVVKLYPNPVKDIVNLEFSEDVQDSKVEVFNTLGQKVKEFTVSGITQNLNISELTQGMYLFRINNNGTTETIKIYKQ